MADPSPTSLLVIGDVHGQWRPEDQAFLESGEQALALFVGDLGDENVEIVRKIARMRADKAVILGNHDAWRSFSEQRITDRLAESIAILGDHHLAYRHIDLDSARVTLIGGRPFSWGGADIRSPRVYGDLYGVGSMRQSADRICEVAQNARYDDLVILAHNGPTGLGSEPTDIYGKDFGRRPRGDFGDQDLAWALEGIRASGKRVRAVIAGHMHDRLSHPRGAERVRFVRDEDTLYVNPAVVPRIRRLESGTIVRHYLRVELAEGQVLAVREQWIDGWSRVQEEVEPDFVDLPVREV